MSTILVTGGAGSIGGALTRRLLEDGHVVRVFSYNDSEQHEFAERLPTDLRANVRLILGDVRNVEAVRRAMRGVSAVFHCAAIKHVPAGNYNAEECADVNIRGTAVVLTATQEEGVTQDQSIPLILLSTDKAVNPTSVMGAAKLVAEQILLRATWADRTNVRVCRFGNVFDSRGSIFPTMLAALKQRRPLMVTSYSATRYIIPIRRAVDLLLTSFEDTRRHKRSLMFLSTMRAASVRQIVEFVARWSGRPFEEIAPLESGLRHGEKMHEECLSEYETFFVDSVTSEHLIVDLNSTPHPCDHDIRLWLHSQFAEPANDSDFEPYYSSRDE